MPEARVRAIRDLTPRVREFEIEPAGGTRAYSAGSHIDVEVYVGGQPETRSYSLVGGPSGVYRIAVQQAREGRGGSRYLWSLAPGAHLSISEPRNLFELAAGRPEYLLIAGGIGITPLVGMAETLGRTGARFRLLYAGRRRCEMPYLAELAAEAFVSEEGRRLDLDAEIGGLELAGELYVCGPMRLLEAARRVWQQQGRPAAQFRFETFASSGSYAARPFVARLADRGIEVAVREDQTLLAALREAGVEVLADCLRGECGLCALNVLEAEAPLDHRDVFLSDAQKAEGRRICACVSRAAGGRITLDTGWRAGYGATQNENRAEN